MTDEMQKAMAYRLASLINRQSGRVPDSTVFLAQSVMAQMMLTNPVMTSVATSHELLDAAYAEFFAKDEDGKS